MASISANEFKLLRDYIEKSCGILVGDEKAYLIESRLSSLMAQNGCNTFAEFYQKAASDRTVGLRDKIVDAMTTNETLWFRDTHPYKVLDEVLLREFADEIAKGKRRKIRIWSAACSTGQEPYSISMIIQEFARKSSVLPLEYVEIVATDISPSALFLAMAGRYDKLSMSRGMTDDFRDRYFDQTGTVWAVKDKVKKMVSFKRFNLQDSFVPLGSFDLVFCRNVAIYFSEQFKRELFRKIAQMLRPTGILFLGASESMSNYSTEYQLMTHDKAMYYRVKQEGKV
ncbi:MAG: protein-glutamate O-methyltransferase CheR [Fibrobacteres bacterium]|nr:protein-glutamate O-methyltransferase CheR [Fibrobacterota bacterium]